MELWIKIQKNKNLKKGLVKVDDLIVDKDSDGKWCLYQDYNTLGIYKTEKRALEVLDEIQNIINSNTFYQEVDSIKIIGKSVVYEMPQE